MRAWRWWLGTAALMLAPALALAQAGVVKGNPRLASLAIEIWPEYDRAGAALVILKAELAPEVKLPAAVSLRIPAASGGPSAVAFSKAAGEGLRNLQFEQQQSADAITLRFDAPERFFHVELYQPFPTILPARSFTYTWPGDLASDRVTIVVQEPAASSGIEIEPKLDRRATGGDGLRYLSAELKAQPAGQALPINVRYTKVDLRTTADIMRPKDGASAALAPAPGAASGTTAPFPPSMIALVVVALVAIGGALLFFWYRRRAPHPQALPHGACTRCGTPRRAGDRFCGHCGAKLA